MAQPTGIKEYCICGFSYDCHNGVLTMEKIQAAVRYLKAMDVEPNGQPQVHNYCCNEFRRDNLRYLEDISK